MFSATQLFTDGHEAQPAYEKKQKVSIPIAMEDIEFSIQHG